MNDDEVHDRSTIQDPPRANRSIAGYRLIREIGAGGMGVVYEAEQRTPRRRVALKVIRGGLAVDEARVRLFQREAHALGRLKHASIATLYEMGSTDEGQPFFAMELVRGASLDEALVDDGSTGVASRVDRLHLFIKICEAVNYAHQRGVIHRDLKPTNIMVARDTAGAASGATRRMPDIKILDFGLARITDADVAAAVSVSAGVVQGTLAYMSPEQARGNPDEIDLRSDVYSLGVILYEMLTGQSPYDLEGRSTLDVLRVICEEAPRPPNRLPPTGAGGRGPERLKLDRDLETILMRSLEKEPARRYQSAHALAEDLERYLADQPILARPPTALYQLRKLVRRHKAGFGFAAGLLVLLASFAVLMAAQAERIARERDRAETEAARASAINDFMQETLGSANPVEGRGRNATVLEVLDEAAARVGQAFPGQPDIEAGVRDTIGLTYYRLGRFEEAEDQFRAALQMQRHLSPEDDARTYTALVNLAVTVHDRGRFREAETLYREALATADRVPSLQPQLVTATLNNLGLLLLDEGELEEAEALFQEVVRRDRTSAAGRSPDLGIDLNNLARVLQERGRLEEADAVFRESLAILIDRGHPYAHIVQGNLAAAICSAGSVSKADPMFEEALSKGGEALGTSHTEVASIAAKHGECLMRHGQAERAEAALLEGHRGLTLALGERHPRTQRVVGHLVELYETSGRAAEAARHRALLDPEP